MERKQIRKENIIDYYIFTTKTGDISVYMDLSQYKNLREKTFFATHQEDVIEAKKKGKLALLDLRTNEIVDESGKRLDIKGKKIFPICVISQIENLLDCVKKAEGKSIIEKEDINTIVNWFEYIKPERKFEKFDNLKKLYDQIERIKNEYGKKFFIKTVKKQFSSKCFIIDKLKKDGSDSICFFKPPYLSDLESTIENNQNLLLFEEVKIKQDENGINREWRAFVVENSLWCLSRCCDRHIDIEDYIIEKVEEKIKEFEGIMPNSYVVDFFEYEKDGKVVFDVLEFNPIVGSGVYQNNDLVF